jgi:hypothetical protein
VVTTGGAAGVHGGAVTGEAPEWPSGGQRLAVNSIGGRGVDGEPISRVAELEKAEVELTSERGG